MNPRCIGVAVTLVLALPGAAWGGPVPVVGMVPVPEGRREAAADTLPSSTFGVRAVRLFDGRDVTSDVTVLVVDGRVAAVGPEIEVAPGVPVVDGRGRTLLPGMVDAHVHTFDPSMLVQALAFGVTLQLDMFTQPGLLAAWRREQEGGSAGGRSDILGGGYLATAPGGHGTQYGFPVPTLSAPEEAGPWVAARAAEGAAFIKIVLEDGSAHGLSRPTLDQAILEALVVAAHDEGLLAVVHVSTLADATRALEAGADGLVHVWVDHPPPSGLVEAMAANRMFVIPTLTVLEGIRGVASGAALLEDDEFRALLDPAARQALTSTFPTSPGTSWEAVQESLGALHQAGVRIITGSDAPNPGTAYGASVHRELELLVAGGLSPVEALRAATSVPAESFGLEGRGVIAPGSRADLVLVEGDPTVEIGATRRIVGVWKEGRAFDHAAFRSDVSAALAAAEAPVPAPQMVDGAILVSDFEDGTAASGLGSGWNETTDAMIGGASTVDLAVVEGGADGSAHALRITGDVAPGAPVSWAGAILFPGARPMEPVDLSATRGLGFHARGAGAAFQVFVFTRGGGQAPAARPFAVREVWDEVFLPWEAFPGVDPAEITAIVIAAGPAPGPFELLVDGVMLR